MKRFSTALLIISMVILLNGCSKSDKDVESTNGSGDEVTTAKTTDNISYPSMDRKGVLWKPVSDSNKKLAVLLNRSYGRPTVKVLDMNKKVIDTGRFVYFSNPNRATYRFARPGRNFPNPCLIQIGSKTYKVDNPAKRHE